MTFADVARLSDLQRLDEGVELHLQLVALAAQLGLAVAHTGHLNFLRRKLLGVLLHLLVLAVHRIEARDVPAQAVLVLRTLLNLLLRTRGCMAERPAALVGLAAAS